MRQFLITIAGVFVGLGLFVLALPFVVIGVAQAFVRPAPVPSASVLVLDLRRGLTDQEAQSPLAALTGRSLSVIGIEDALREADHDSRVKGLVVRLPDGGMEPGAADELRLAFKRFRASGKPILVYSQGIYDVGAAASTYALATAGSELWMQDDASFQATGMADDAIFFKRFFDKHGVVADFQQRYQYKTAINPYLYSDFTPAQREEDLSWMGSIFATALSEAAADRRMSEPKLQSIIEAGPYSAYDALAKGLIDKVGDLRTAEKTVLDKAGANAKLITLSSYARSSGPVLSSSGDPEVAVIFGEGDIVGGEGGGAPNPFGGGQAMHADAIASAFYRAIEDPKVKAIVFRISTPGGSDTASEEIANAVSAAVAGGKPVVVSMGTYGASGGYWISAGASRIVAEPTTLTGSIGVFGGKFALGPALARFGIDIRTLDLGGDFTGAYSTAQPMSATQRAAYSKMIDEIYNGFVARVAAGRRLPISEVAAIAKGRVWTGAQAVKLGLVDQLGGFYKAVGDAKTLANLRGKIRLVPYNNQLSPFQSFVRALGGGVEGVRVLSALGEIAADPDARALIGEIHDGELRAQGAAVLAPTRF
ncbi:MAG: signal peptide peptidase SppA [Caulobacteraceae bacterium]